MEKKKIAELAKVEQRNYVRNWRSQNKEKVKTYNQNYWLRKAEKKLSEMQANNKED